MRVIAQKLYKKLLETKQFKSLEILEVAKKLPSNLWKALGRRARRGGGGGVRGFSVMVASERLRPKVLTLIYTIFDKRYPLSFIYHCKVVPFVRINR